MSVSETMKALGTPADFEWQGRTLKVSPVTFDIEGRFAALLAKKVAEGLSRDRLALGAAYEDALRAYRDDLAAGEFGWGGRVYRNAEWSWTGTLDLAYLCLQKCQPDFPRSEMERIFRDRTPYPDPTPATPPAPDAPPPTRTKWQELVRLLVELQAVPPNG